MRRTIVVEAIRAIRFNPCNPFEKDKRQKTKFSLLYCPRFILSFVFCLFEENDRSIYPIFGRIIYLFLKQLNLSLRGISWANSAEKQSIGNLTYCHFSIVAINVSSSYG